MAGVQSPLVIVGISNAVIALACALWIRLHRPVRGMRSFVVLLLCVAGWSAADALERLATTVQGKLLWVQVGYLFVIAAPVAFLAFVLRFSPSESGLSRGQSLMLAVEPVLMAALTVTNGLHGAIWSAAALDPFAATAPLLVEHGPWFWIHTAYCHLLGGVGLLSLLRWLRAGSRLLRTQTSAVLAAGFSGWLGSLLSIALPELHRLPLLVGLALTNAIVIWSLFRYRLFQLVPLARAAIFEQMDAAALVLDEAGRVVDMNPRAEELLGHPAAKVVGQLATEALADQGPMFEPWRNENRWHQEVAVADGQASRFYDLHVSPLRDERDELRGRLVVIRDITVARRAAEQLRQGVVERQRLEGVSEQRRLYLESVLHSAPDAIVTLDHQHHVREWNRGAEQLFGYTAAEARGRDLDELVTGASGEALSEARGLTNQVLAGQEVPPQEVTRYRKDGTPVDVIVAGSPISLQGELIGAVAAYRDISERKRAEQQLQSSLREKEILLKEVHHRVKNNLQVVSSLLYLQAIKAGEGPAAAMLQDSLNRVRSMAMVHEQLYGSQDLARIDLGEYVRSLSASLLNCYAPQPGQVQVAVDVQDIWLALDLAIPCGLIITELVSNALRHAFPDGRRGRIRITCAKDGVRRYRLEVSDDGVGLPDLSVTAESDTLGLGLVDMLVQQLHGQLEVERKHGTLFRITFIAPTDHAARVHYG